MERLLTARESAVLALSFSAVHVGTNVLADDSVAPRCPYDEAWGLVASVGTFLLFALVAWAEAHAWRPHWRLPHVRDVVGLVPGIWFQITTKPAAFFASVPVEGCDMRSSGYAMALWILGEMLTFGAGLRLATAWGFGRRAWPTVAIVLSAIGLQAVVVVASRALSTVYDA